MRSVTKPFHARNILLVPCLVNVQSPRRRDSARRVDSSRSSRVSVNVDYSLDTDYYSVSTIQWHWQRAKRHPCYNLSLQFVWTLEFLKWFLRYCHFGSFWSFELLGLFCLDFAGFNPYLNNKQICIQSRNYYYNTSLQYLFSHLPLIFLFRVMV